MCQFLNYAQVNEALFCSDRLTIILTIHASRIWHFMPDVTCTRNTWRYLSDVKFRSRDSLIRPLLWQLRKPIIMYILTPVIYFLIYIWNGWEYLKKKGILRKKTERVLDTVFISFTKSETQKRLVKLSIL